ncbi:MAG: acyl-ACP--UDP-N-acetylglucosamine O-acyltransferase [Firmicutes bacterium]|nr:acyl-ACP--UDP-N-acetylglucosamine O-acyltransferase [Bacillota bacterium]
MEVGPFSIIGKNVVIGKGNVIESSVLITGWTTIGENNRFFKGAVIGEWPQDIKYNGEPSYTDIGNGNVFREYVTVHRGAEPGTRTIIGNNNLLMAYVHVAHNCKLGSDNTIANYVGFAGHVEVEDMVTFGGLCGIHQFARIGKMAMVAGYSKVIQDVPPFTLVEGMPARIMGLNIPGLRRRGLTSESRNALKKAISIITSRKQKRVDAIETVRQTVEVTPEVEHLLNYVANPSRKGVILQTAYSSKDEE